VEPILKTENLWKLYRAGKVDVPALRGVNFEVQPANPWRSWPFGLWKILAPLCHRRAGAGVPWEGLVDGND